MDIQAHWLSLYTAMRAGLDADGFSDVSLIPVHSGDSGPNSESASPPFVAYSQAPGRTIGTTGGGSLKVVNDRWMVTSRAVDLNEALDLASSCVNAVTDKVLTTSDGYVTTTIEPTSTQSIFEHDAKLYAFHVWFEWERSL